MSTKHRFFANEDKIKRGYYIIDDRKSCKYIRKVLRLKLGTEIIVFDGEGNEYLASLDFITTEKVSGKLLEELKSEETSEGTKFYMILAQGLPRAGKLDDIIRMNTEVGIKEFYFFETEYSVVKVKDFTPERFARLDRLATEASRQSERSFIPKSHFPMTFAEILAIPADVKILLHSRETSGSKDLNEIKKKIKPDQQVLVIIGPEGGFSPKELELAEKNKIQIAYLNLPILRTGTAGIVACGILLS